jgi:hypothetical protein
MDAVEVALVTEEAGENRLGVDALNLEPALDQVAAGLRLGALSHAVTCGAQRGFERP